MRIDPKDTVAGLPILRVRDFLRKARGSWGLQFLCHHLQLSSGKGKDVLRTFEASGYIERDERHERAWTTTLAGNSLSLATAARSLRRATAERIVREFLERVRQVNEDEYFLCRVAKVLVFGSYLSDQERINDIDLVVELAHKHDAETHQKLNRQRVAEGSRHRSTPKDFVNQLFLAELEVQAFLKHRSRALSLHTPDDGIVDQVHTEVLFEMSEC